MGTLSCLWKNRYLNNFMDGGVKMIFLKQKKSQPLISKRLALNTKNQAKEFISLTRIIFIYLSLTPKWVGSYLVNALKYQKNIYGS